HHCNELRSTHCGQTVCLVGWVHSRRDHGGVIFIDLRDREGLTQIVFNPENSQQAAEAAKALRSEFVVQVSGKVVSRLEGTENKNLPTGQVEIHVNELAVLNSSETPPFPLDEESVNEDLRLTYRYLDLRRQSMAKNLRLRHQASKAVRD